MISAALLFSSGASAFSLAGTRSSMANVRTGGISNSIVVLGGSGGTGSEAVLQALERALVGVDVGDELLPLLLELGALLEHDAPEELLLEARHRDGHVDDGRLRAQLGRLRGARIDRESTHTSAEEARRTGQGSRAAGRGRFESPVHAQSAGWRASSRGRG